MNTLKDVVLLKNNPNIDRAYSEYIGHCFTGLMRLFAEGKSSSEFSLEGAGHIIVLESTDGIRGCLSGLGIADLLEAPIEYCNRVELQTGEGKVISV